jgi:hypothetical protein
VSSAAPQQSFDPGAHLAQTRFGQSEFGESPAFQLVALLIDPWHANEDVVRNA